MSEERTTQREIAQDKVNNDMMFMLGEMKASVKSIEKNFDKLTPIIEDHESRITANTDALTNVKVKIGLIGAFIGAVFSIIGNWIWKRVTGH